MFRLIALFGLSATTAFAVSFDTEIALEREPFEYAATSTDGLIVEDTTDDLVVFDRQNRQTLPPVLADMTYFKVEPQEESWLVTFEIAEALPEDPGLAVNFDVFIDIDGDESNNPNTGVYRAHSDTIYMILHGSRTKWHSKYWTYDSSTGLWTEQPQKPAYEIGDGTYSLEIPYDQLPKESDIPIRGFSLTSTGGITAIDVIPGAEFPPVLAVQPTPPQAEPPPPKPQEQPTGGQFSIQGLLSPTVIYSIVAFLLGFSLAMLWKNRRKKEKVISETTEQF